MKSTGVLKERISKISAIMRNIDRLIMNNASLPIPEDGKKINFTVVAGVLPFLDALKTVRTELNILCKNLTEEIKKYNSAVVTANLILFHQSEVKYISHKIYKQQSWNPRAIIRARKCSQDANFVLEFCAWS